jgi:hypothetical protein
MEWNGSGRFTHKAKNEKRPLEFSPESSAPFVVFRSFCFVLRCCCVFVVLQMVPQRLLCMLAVAVALVLGLATVHSSPSGPAYVPVVLWHGV